MQTLDCPWKFLKMRAWKWICIREKKGKKQQKVSRTLFVFTWKNPNTEVYITWFSALAVTPPTGTPVFFPSKQTAKTHLFTSGPEPLESNHKQGSKTMHLTGIVNSIIKCKILYGINNKTSSPIYYNFDNVNFFSRITSTHSSTPWPCARKSCIPQWRIYFR